MSAGLLIERIAPGASLQDFGRPGYLAKGLSRGGAMDPLALAEGAALLGEAIDKALAIELPGAGGIFVAKGADLLIALSGAPMQAEIEGRVLHWPGSHILREGECLKITAPRAGIYGYLSLRGMRAEQVMGACSAHLAAGVGALLQAGDLLAAETGEGGGKALDPLARFDGGTVRVVPSVQTVNFSPDLLQRFESTEFRKDARANRMGAKLTHDGEGFATDRQLSLLSEIIVPGDIQVLGDGTPFVLMPECQSMGGYPRIATVISADLARVAQAAPGSRLRFQFVSLEEALKARAEHKRHLKSLPGSVRNRVRDPHDMADLLSYQLISGAVSARQEET